MANLEGRLVRRLFQKQEDVKLEFVMSFELIQNFNVNNFCSIMLCKIFVVFEISEVKEFRFWPLKCLITYV